MCKCCAEIEFWKIRTPDKTKFKEKFFAKISVYTWKQEQRAIKGHQVSSITSEPFDLNYCPMCGRNLGGIKPNE